MIIDVQGRETEQEALLRQETNARALQVVPVEEEAPAPPDWDDGDFNAEVATRNAATAAARTPIGAVGSVMMDPRTVSLPSDDGGLGVDAPTVFEQPGAVGEQFASPPAAHVEPDRRKRGGAKSEKLRSLESAAVLEVVALKDVVAAEQPRKHFDEEKLNELAESIKHQGLIQPPLLLRVGDRYQIVVGERRVRASKLAGLRAIPALVRTDLTQEEILDAQVAENVNREDLCALEEAAAYGRMVASVEKGGLGRSVEEVAAKVGKSRVWVYGRLKLLDLCVDGQKALQRGELTPSVAEAVARIDGHDRQRKCLADMEGLRPWHLATKPEDREPASVRSALELIRTKYMLDLSKAPFDRKDDLLTSAGSCTACPSNSANQLGDLFATKTRGYCLKAECHKEKCEASWEKEKARAEKKGHKVLSLAKGRELYRGGMLRYDGAYVELHGPCVDDEKRRTYKVLLGLHCPPVTVCPDADGKPREIIDRAEATKGLAAAGHGFAKEAAQTSKGDDVVETRGTSTKERAKEHAREEKVRELITSELVEATVRRVEAKGLTLADLRALAGEVVLGGSWEAIEKRRGLKGGYQGMVKEIARASERELQGMLMEMYLTGRGMGPDLDQTEELAKLAGLKMADLEKKVRESLALGDKAEEAAQARAAAKAGGGTKKSGKKS